MNPPVRTGRALVRVSILGVALALAGCAGVRGGAPVGPVATAQERAARDARLAALDTFSFGGGFGYRDDERNVAARIGWRQRGTVTDIDLSGPLGLGRTSLHEDASGATLRRGDGAPSRGPDAASLLQAVLGLAAPIPLDAVRDWIRGLPGEGAREVERDAGGRLTSLGYTDAAGQRWHARVRRYRTVDGLDLPALLSARSGDRRLRLALSDWRFEEASDGPPVEPPDGRAPAGGDRLTIPGR